MGKTPSFSRADRSGAVLQQRQSGAAELLMFRPTPAESSAAMAPTAREHFLGHVQGGPVLLDPLNGPHLLCLPSGYV
jgi:hypothetical protein